MYGRFSKLCRSSLVFRTLLVILATMVHQAETDISGDLQSAYSTPSSSAGSPPPPPSRRGTATPSWSASSGTRSTSPPTSSVSYLDLIASLNLHNSTFSGVEIQQGPHFSTPALHFTGSTRTVYYSTVARDSLASIVRSSKEFSFLTSIRQRRHNSGTLIALSFGKLQYYRYIEIQSSGRRDELRIHYWPKYATSHLDVQVETFPMRLADDSWHRLGIVISGDQIDILLDCRRIYSRVLRRELDTSFSPFSEDLTLWIGQRNPNDFLFKGYLQGARIVGGEYGYLEQCPSLDTACPTCGQFSALENTVNHLLTQVEELTSKLNQAHHRISQLEECECSKNCVLAGGSVKRNQESWLDGCDNCICNNGIVSCAPECPELQCASPIPPSPGSCCPTCGASCPLFNLTHGEVSFPKPCHRCQCVDGVGSCRRLKNDCPPLHCDPSQQIHDDNQCCPVCKGTDWCSLGHDCDEFADCVSDLFTHSCHCKPGYQGDGRTCVDVNECSGSNHLCTAPNSRCVNQPGSYTCQCQPGFRDVDGACRPINPCDEPVCGESADCVYLGPGRHRCSCRSGFSQQGNLCVAECLSGCDNGGKCVAPDTCECAPGFTGAHCEEDVDECASAPCGAEARCVNMVGWYYCACKPGFVSYHNPLDGQHACVDEDECATSEHTCHPPARCQNTLGGYRCVCAAEDASSCSSACLVEGGRVEDGTRWEDGCSTCTCDQGRVTCVQTKCDCSLHIDSLCCPECHVKKACPHQGVPGKVYMSGDRWIHHCMECECLNGEVDCWPLDCPDYCPSIPSSSSSSSPTSSSSSSCCTNQCKAGSNNSTLGCKDCFNQVSAADCFNGACDLHPGSPAAHRPLRPPADAERPPAGLEAGHPPEETEEHVYFLENVTIPVSEHDNYIRIDRIRKSGSTLSPTVRLSNPAMHIRHSNSYRRPRHRHKL